jgi:hypothetical protein
MASRLAVRRHLEKVEQRDRLPDPPIEIELNHESGEATGYTERIWWTTEERQAVARRAAFLRCSELRTPLGQLLAKAQRSVLDHDRHRPDTSLNADIRTMVMAEEYGKEIAGFYSRYDEIDRKLEAFRKLQLRENEVVNILSSDKATPAEIKRLMEVITPSDVLKVIPLAELISAASPQELLVATFAKALESGSEIYGSIVSLVEKLDHVTTHLAVTGANGHANGHNGHTNGFKSVVERRIVLYGVPDAASEKQVRDTFPSTAKFVFAGKEDYDPNKITKDVAKVVCNWSMMTKRQRQMVEKRIADLRLPEDVLSRVPGGFDRFMAAVGRQFPKTAPVG